MPNLVVSNPVDSFMAVANQVAMLAALANGGVFDFSTFTFKLPGSVQFATKTLNVSNSLTLAGVDGSTLNIGAGGALAGMAFQDPGAVNIINGSATLSNLTCGNAVLTGGSIDNMGIGGSTRSFANVTGIDSFSGMASGGEGMMQNDYPILSINGNSAWLEVYVGSTLSIVVSTTPSTPTGKGVFYCSSAGQMHVLDINAVDINLSLCPQPDTGWTGNGTVGDKTVEVPSYFAAGAGSILNGIDPNSAQQIEFLTNKLCAIQEALFLKLYPNS